MTRIERLILAGLADLVGGQPHSSGGQELYKDLKEAAALPVTSPPHQGVGLRVYRVDHGKFRVVGTTSAEQYYYQEQADQTPLWKCFGDYIEVYTSQQISHRYRIERLAHPWSGDQPVRWGPNEMPPGIEYAIVLGPNQNPELLPDWEIA